MVRYTVERSVCVYESYVKFVRKEVPEKFLL
jgi:hypothetical protein